MSFPQQNTHTPLHIGPNSSQRHGGVFRREAGRTLPQRPVPYSQQQCLESVWTAARGASGVWRCFSSCVMKGTVPRELLASQSRSSTSSWLLRWCTCYFCNMHFQVEELRRCLEFYKRALTPTEVRSLVPVRLSGSRFTRFRTYAEDPFPLAHAGANHHEDTQGAVL